jgi:hypothetical protein
VSTEALISSPNYPYFYGDDIEYIWDVHFADALALKVDIIDIHIPPTGEDVSYQFKRTSLVLYLSFRKLT